MESIRQRVSQLQEWRSRSDVFVATDMKLALCIRCKER